MLKLRPAIQRFSKRYFHNRKSLLRTHLTSRKLDPAKIRHPDWGYAHTGMKPPCAFWYGFNDSWIFLQLLKRWNYLDRYIYELEVDESQVLRISNNQQFDAFTKEFGTSLIAAQLDLEFILAGLDMGERLRRININWLSVSKRYGAVEIYPFINGCEDTWFQTWDCASGCILNPGIIKKVQLFARYDPQNQQYVRCGVYNRVESK